MDAPQPIYVSIFSNYTARPVKRALSFWMQKQGVESNITFSESYQFIPLLYDTNSLFYNKESSLSVIFFRFENCFAADTSDELDFDQCAQFILDFQNALIFAVKNHACPIIVIESPLSKKLTLDNQEEKISYLSKRFRQQIADIPNVYYEPKEFLIDLYPMESYHDEAGYTAALMPYSIECYTALGSVASRKISAFLKKPKKVVVLDCDNTLWHGVAAEDGVSGLSINENHVWLQNFMVRLYNNGLLLCLCSKNIEQDIWDVFRYYHESMPLKKENFVAWRINWEPKSKNIVSLSEELNLGLESFIFVDDNPIEIGEVGAECPAVTCLQIPNEHKKIPNFLKHQWVFDVPNVSKLDGNRTEYYLRESKRKSVESDFTDYDQFLRHLNVELSIEDLTENLVDRASQLALRTNQFNFSGMTLGYPELIKRISNSSSRCTLVTARDRFGDYGVIGCLFYSIKHGSLVLENFMLSCRALGKKIEYQMWDWLVDFVRQNDLNHIEIVFIVTQRNRPAYDFLTSLGLVNDSYDGQVIRYVLPAMCD